MFNIAEQDQARLEGIKKVKWVSTCIGGAIWESICNGWMWRMSFSGRTYNIQTHSLSHLGIRVLIYGTKHIWGFVYLYLLYIYTCACVCVRKRALDTELGWVSINYLEGSSECMKPKQIELYISTICTCPSVSHFI